MESDAQLIRSSVHRIRSLWTAELSQLRRRPYVLKLEHTNVDISLKIHQDLQLITLLNIGRFQTYFSARSESFCAQLLHSSTLVQSYCQLSVHQRAATQQLSAKVFKLSFEYLHIYSLKSGDFCRTK